MTSKYHLFVIVLKDCPYSNKAIELLEKNNLKNKTIETVTQKNKDMYKTAEISTFPQIYLKKYNSKNTLLLGGYSDLENVYNNFYKIKEDQLTNKLDRFMFDKNWSRKATLRLACLINNLT